MTPASAIPCGASPNTYHGISRMLEEPHSLALLLEPDLHASESSVTSRFPATQSGHAKGVGIRKRVPVVPAARKNDASHRLNGQKPCKCQLMSPPVGHLTRWS